MAQGRQQILWKLVQILDHPTGHLFYNYDVYFHDSFYRFFRALREVEKKPPRFENYKKNGTISEIKDINFFKSETQHAKKKLQEK